jgi:hypothetical protein
MALGNIDKLIRDTTRKSKTTGPNGKTASSKMRKTYYLEEALVEAVRVYAFHQRTNVSRVVNEAVRKYLKK